MAGKLVIVAMSMWGSAHAFSPSTLRVGGIISKRTAFSSLISKRVTPHLGLAKLSRTRELSRCLQMVAATEVSAPKIVGPEWDNSDEYDSLSSPKIKQDLKLVENLVEEMKAISGKIDISKLDLVDTEDLVQITIKATEASILLGNVGTFASCECSIDGTNTEALALSATVRSLSSKMTQAVQPASLALKLLPDNAVERYVQRLPEEAFGVSHQRKLRDQTLSLAEENLLTALTVDGHQAWSQLHSSISSTLTVSVGSDSMGSAQAAALLSGPDPARRRLAWDGIRAAWRQHEHAAAAVLNSIVGWRVEVNRRRAAVAGRPVHYLDAALHQNRMGPAALRAMMAAIKEAEPMARRALLLQVPPPAVPRHVARGPKPTFAPARAHTGQDAGPGAAPPGRSDGAAAAASGTAG